MEYRKEIWIRSWYEIFALSGRNGFKIEKLAKTVGISKSSFYHHFAYLDIFIGQWCEYHVESSFILANKEKNIKNIQPELIDILLEHKTNLLFHRQLRINRNIDTYRENLKLSTRVVGNAFIMIWVKDLQLELEQNQLASLFELALENFYLQMNNDNITYQWLAEYFKNPARIAKSFE